MPTKHTRQHDTIHTSTETTIRHNQQADPNNETIHDGHAGHIPAWVFVIPALILAVAAAIFILNPAESNNSPTSELLAGDNALESDSTHIQQLPGI